MHEARMMLDRNEVNARMWPIPFLFLSRKPMLHIQ